MTLRLSHKSEKMASIEKRLGETWLNNQTSCKLACSLVSHYIYTWNAIRGSKSVVDVGCGKGWSMQNLRRFGLNCHLVGVDLFPLYVRECKKRLIHDDYVIADARFLPFKNNAFSASLCLEVIEHSPKNHGFQILREIERVARTVVVTSPADWGIGVQVDKRNPYQLHRSRWRPEDLRRLGYKVKGFWGLKIVSAPAPVAVLSGVLFAPILSILPRYALHMIGLKTTNARSR
jgi:SAM-dependent methyltransferase